MTKYFIASVCLGLVVSWIIIGSLHRPSGPKRNADGAMPGRISLLGAANAKSAPGTVRTFSEVQAMLIRLDSASPEQLKRWLIELVESGKASKNLIELVVARLTSLGPQEAFEFLTTNAAFKPYFPIVLAEWARTNLTAAFTAYLSQEPSGGMIKEIMAGMNGEDCERAYLYLIEQGFDRAHPESFTYVFSYLVQNDPVQTAERALDFSRRGSESSMEYAMTHVFSRWYREDPEGAFEWVTDQHDSISRKIAAGALAEVVVQRDGAEGFDRVWDLLDDTQRSHLGRNIHHFGDDIDATLDWAAETIGSPQHHRELLDRLLLELTYNGEPQDIMKILDHWEGDYSGTNLETHVSKISQRWARENVEGLERWMMSIKDPLILAAAQKGVMYHLVAEDPLAAIEYWERHSDVFEESVTLDETQLIELIGGVFDEMGEHDPAAMMDLLPTAWKDQANWMYGWHFAERDPEKAVGFLKDQPPGESRDRALHMAVGYWATQDPSQAADWVRGLDQGEEKELATQNLARNWARSDPAAAMTWLRAQPESELRNEAAKEIFEMSFHAFPEMSLDLVLDMPSGSSADHANYLSPILASLTKRHPELMAELIGKIADKEPNPNGFSLSSGMLESIAEDIQDELQIREKFETTPEITPERSLN